MSVESSSTSPMLVKALPRIKKELDVVWSSRSIANATGKFEVVLVEVGEVAAVINLGWCDDIFINLFPGIPRLFQQRSSHAGLVLPAAMNPNAYRVPSGNSGCPTPDAHLRRTVLQ